MQRPVIGRINPAGIPGTVSPGHHVVTAGTRSTSSPGHPLHAKVGVPY
jgi:hypothetical protein